MKKGSEVPGPGRGRLRTGSPSDWKMEGNTSTQREMSQACLSLLALYSHQALNTSLFSVFLPWYILAVLGF